MAPLALDPQVAVLFLEDLELLLALYVDIADAALTVCAYNLLVLLEEDAAADALFLDGGELEKAGNLVSLRRHV